MKSVTRQIDRLGRIVLPIDFRKALGIVGEADVEIGIEGGTIIVRRGDHTCKLCGSHELVSRSLMICCKCIDRIKHTES